MDVGKKKANEELDLTQVAESLGGYIVEAPVEDGKIVAGKDEAKKQKKIIKKIETGREKGERALTKAISGVNVKTQGEEPAAATDAFADMRMSDDPKFSNITSDVKKGMRATAAGKGKAEPKKPAATRANFPKTRAELETKRKDYEIDPKTNQPSAAGVEKFARRSLFRKQQASGSNVPIELSPSDLDTAREKMVGTGEKGTDVGKYGGRLAGKRRKGQPTLDQVKADIDKRNPTYRGIAGGELPFSNRLPRVRTAFELIKQNYKNRNMNDPDPDADKQMRDAENDPQGQEIRSKIEKETGTKIRPVEGEKGYSGMMGRIEKAQQKSTVAATGGLLAKTMNPALAGVEAMSRYQRGDKRGAMLSTVQAIGGPIGFGAGAINALRTRTAVQAAVGGDGGDKKKTAVATSPGDGGGGGETDGATTSLLGYQAFRDTFRKLRRGAKLPGVTGGRAIQVSAKQ